MDRYQAEARERWGDTPAYTEYDAKTKGYSQNKWDQANNGLMAIFAAFSTLKESGTKPNSPQAQDLVVKLQQHITDHYYTCTDEILKGLGQMYVADERFKKNIDKCSAGTAKYVRDAIASYFEVQ